MNDPIGFIGMGNMGMPMVSNLSQSGKKLIVYDIDPAVCGQAGVLEGVQAASSPAEVAAGCVVLFTVLPNDEIVTEIYLGKNGIHSAGPKGLICCDCSTVSPGVTVHIDASAREKSIHHMDTPMLGSKPQAESGEIFFIVAGSEAQLPVIAPHLEVMGRLYIYVGPAGTANRIKLIHNVLGAVNSVAVAESLALCVQAGVDPEVFHQVVADGGGMAFSTYFGKRVERILNGDFSPQFSLELMHKDVNLALSIAEESGITLPIMEETRKAYAEGLENGWGDEDFSAVTHVIEKKLGKSISK